MGSGVLAIDEAVFKVINMARAEKGLPELTREQLEAMGVIDAVATTTDQPNVYNVKGILAMIVEEGTQVTIKGSQGVSIGGEATQSVPGPAGTAEWPSVTVDPEAQQATITVAPDRHRSIQRDQPDQVRRQRILVRYGDLHQDHRRPGGRER